MNYTLRIAGQDIPIEANRVDDETISAAVNDKNVTVRYRNVSANQLYLEVNGEAVNAFISDDGTGKIVHVDGIAYLVQDAEELARSAGRKKGGKDMPQEITPPMPSVVVSVMVSEGDEVEKGQSVVVVSAMKMETTLSAPFKGKVTKINVKEGQKVMPGEILVDIEKCAEEEIKAL